MTRICLLFKKKIEILDLYTMKNLATAAITGMIWLNSLGIAFSQDALISDGVYTAKEPTGNSKSACAVVEISKGEFSKYIWRPDGCESASGEWEPKGLNGGSAKVYGRWIYKFQGQAYIYTVDKLAEDGFVVERTGGGYPNDTLAFSPSE